MANQRHPDQKLVAFALDKDLLAALDNARHAAGMDRSRYIRAAVVEKLQSLKVPLPNSLKDAPDRTGKTYRPRKIESYRAEDRKQKRAVNSKPAAGVTEALDAVEAAVGRRRSKS